MNTTINTFNPKTKKYVSWGIFFASLFGISLLDRTILTIPYIGDIALVLFGITLGGIFLITTLRKQKIQSVPFGITTIILFLFFVYMISEIIQPIKGIKSVFQIFLIALFFWGAVQVIYQPTVMKILGYFWTVIVFLNLSLWIIGGLQYPFGGIFLYKNVLGGVTALGIFFLTAARYTSIRNNQNLIFWNLGILVSLLLLIASGSRASWLLIVFAYITYYIWPIISKKILVSIIFICLIIIVASGTAFIYVEFLKYQEAWVEVNRIIYEITGQHLYSGRQILWIILIEEIQKQPFGHGPGASPEYFLPTGLSAHNLYMQIMLQVGIIGLGFLLLAFILIWLQLTKNRKNQISRLSASFMVGIIFHQVFEVSLTQNALVIGFMMWGIMAAGVGQNLLTSKRRATK